MVKPLEEHLEPGAPEKSEPAAIRTILGLSLIALGVVYGDIGTSPLYAVKSCFYAEGSIAPLTMNVFGVVSLIFCSLIIIISIKYMTYVLNADNRGEGGILALMSLVHPRDRIATFDHWFLVNLGLIGAALLYGGHQHHAGNFGFKLCGRVGSRHSLLFLRPLLCLLLLLFSFFFLSSRAGGRRSLARQLDR
jgi:K+ potassium transporter integral membrane domain